MQIVVPHNLPPDRKLIVATPSGARVAIQVPPNVQPGQAIQVQVPAAASAPPAQVIEVVVPPGVSPGMQIRVMAPNGQAVAVVVPPGLGPGSKLQVKVPDPLLFPSTGCSSTYSPCHTTRTTYFPAHAPSPPAPHRPTLCPRVGSCCCASGPFPSAAAAATVSASASVCGPPPIKSTTRCTHRSRGRSGGTRCLAGSSGRRRSHCCRLVGGGIGKEGRRGGGFRGRGGHRAGI